MENIASTDGREGIEPSRIPTGGTYSSDGTVQDELGEAYYQPEGKVEMRCLGGQ